MEYHYVDNYYNINDSNNTSLNSTNNTEFYYHYSYDESINNIPIGELSIVATVYGLTLVLGVLGNALVIFTIVRIRRMQSVTNIFLTSLASADLLLLLICVPIKFAKWFSFTWDFGVFLCKAVHYLQNVSVICSVLTLTAMSLERYYAICHPMRAKYKCTKSRAKKIIIGLWILSFVFASPIIYGQIHMKVGDKKQAYWRIDNWRSENLTKAYAVSMLFLILLLPFIIMTMGYTAICVELWVNMTNNFTNQRHGDSMVWNRNSSENKQRLQPRASYKNPSNTRKQVIKMLVIIIVLFTVCWGPTLIDNVLAAFRVVNRLNYEHLKHMRQAFALMSYSNSCVNPVVYAFMSKHWRQSFRSALCICTNSDMKKRTRTYNHYQMSPIANASVVNYHMKKDLVSGVKSANNVPNNNQMFVEEYSNNHPTVTLSDYSPNESNYNMDVDIS